MIIKDLLNTFIAVLSVIVVIIVSRKFVKILEKAIEGVISPETLVNILGLKMISAAITFLPAAIFMSTLMVIGRMYRDQEMSAIFSAGGGTRTIFRSLFILIIPLIFVAAGLALYLGPWSEALTKELLFNDEKTAELRGITAGRFSEYQKGDLIFYVENIDPFKKMQNVFVQKRLAHNKVAVSVAKSARMEQLPDGLYMILESGQKVLGVPGGADFIIEEFDEYAFRIEDKQTVLDLDRQSLPTNQLLKSSNIKDTTELVRRVSIPISLVFLGVLAVPLAQTRPRSGIYGNLLTAFLIYFSYGNLERVSQSWMIEEKMPLWLGASWLYAALLLVIGLLLIRLYNWKFVKQKFKELVAS